MFYSTVARAHVSTAGAKGGKTIRRSAVRVAASQPNTPQSRPRRLAARLPSDQGRSQRQPQLRTPARHRTRYVAARRHHRQKYDAKTNRDGAASATLSGHTASRDCNRQTRFLPENPLQSASAHRADHRQTQALQAHRPSLREDCAQLRSFVALALGIILIKSVT